jgi:hypothetical protein
MGNITYQDKDKTVLDGVRNKWRDIDANEVKARVNEKADIEYVDEQIAEAVVGLFDDRGNHNASTNLFPSTGGSGASGAVLKGDLWTVSVAGTLGGQAVQPGDTIRALTDAPGQTAGNWAVSYSGRKTVQVIASTATLTPNLSLHEAFQVTDLAVPLTIANPTGGPIRNLDGFILAVKDNGSAQALTLAVNYRAFGSPFPATTTAGKWIYFTCIYNADDNAFDVSVIQQT